MTRKELLAKRLRLLRKADEVYEIACNLDWRKGEDEAKYLWQRVAELDAEVSRLEKRLERWA